MPRRRFRLWRGFRGNCADCVFAFPVFPLFAFWDAVLTSALFPVARPEELSSSKVRSTKFDGGSILAKLVGDHSKARQNG